ncbi:MAG: flavin reductase family protein [candidate division WOR-3 bacterium]|nr:MAG: flavin reductase family protein [candidate division WOR-3 bacterium]
MHTTTDLEKFYYLFPQTVAVIGVGKNLMPAAWHTPISAKPPLYGVLISPKRYTYEILPEHEGFTVNFLLKDQADLIAKLGSTSGRDIDKLSEFRVAIRNAEKIEGVIMSASYGAYECRKYALHEYGDHFLLIGQVLSIHVNREMLLEQNLIDENMVKPVLYFGKDRYLTINPDTLSIHKKD